MARVPAFAFVAFVVLGACLPPAAAAQTDGLAEATKAYNAGDYAAALKGFLPLAEAGNAEVQTLVAGIYARGLGTAPDPAKAARWYAKAADQGEMYATTMLGWFYLRGIGVPQDPVRGYRLLARAATQFLRGSSASGA